MKINCKKQTLSGIAIACLISLMLAFVAPQVARAASSAELKGQLAAAQEKLSQMAQATAAAGEALNDTKYQLSQTEEQITKTKKEIEDKKAALQKAQRTLSERIDANYRAGNVNFLSIILESDSFEDFVSRVYYADKVSESDAHAIDTVQKIQESLEKERVTLEAKEKEQKTLVTQQEEQTAALQKKQAEQQSYVNGLSAQVQAALKAEREAELARQRAEAKRRAEQAAAAARRAEAEEAARRNNSSSSSSSSHSGGTSYPTSPSAPTSVSVSGSTRQKILQAAYSQMGVPYVWAAMSPGYAFDCSGFTSWCYSQAGISIPHSAYGQYAMSTHQSTSSLQPGDLVFWIGNANSGSGNHVAIYIGNGQIIHANGSLVTISALSGSATCGGFPR